MRLPLGRESPPAPITRVKRMLQGAPHFSLNQPSQQPVCPLPIHWPWSKCQGLRPAQLCAEELAQPSSLPSCYFPMRLLRWMECPGELVNGHRDLWVCVGGKLPSDSVFFCPMTAELWLSPSQQ